ncbi:hypothetical protein MMC14_006644 [Varicellaria rhodocarpa]|nr:hypothetical protein [Varicellaria rhodocarpa]
MSFKLLITGATGTAGAEAVRQALNHPSISQVTVLSRRPLPSHVVSNPESNPKLKVIEHKDFLSYPTTLLYQLKGHQAVLWDLGISSAGFKETDYEVITKDYALAAAKAFATLGSVDEKFVFCYLSGDGTDQRDGKAWTMFGRVKGRAERDLALLPSEYQSLATYSFRPAAILPSAPIPEAPRTQKILTTIVPVLRPFMKAYVIDASVLARGMIEAALKGASGEIKGWEGKGQAGNEGVFANEEIKALAGKATR